MSLIRNAAWALIVPEEDRAKAALRIVERDRAIQAARNKAVRKQNRKAKRAERRAACSGQPTSV